MVLDRSKFDVLNRILIWYEVIQQNICAANIL